MTALSRCGLYFILRRSMMRSISKQSVVLDKNISTSWKPFHTCGGLHTDEIVNMTFIDQNGEHKSVQGKVGDNVMYLAHRHNVEIEGACKASLACSTCHVYVKQKYFDILPEPEEGEEDMLDLAPFLQENSRLKPASILNGALNSGSSYQFTQRGLDKERKVIEYQEWSVEAQTLEKIPVDEEESNVGVIVGVIVAIVIVLVRLKADGKLVDGGDNDAPDNHGYQFGETIAVSDFSDHCRILAADSNYLYSQEYSHIPCKNASKTMHHAQKQDNRECNRYNDILCYDATRVILKTDPTGNDYINASYLSGFEKEKAYIASQGPLENTCEQFWRMVWENSTRTIVMVTGLEEGRKIKCHQYWPSSNSMEYGPFVVTLLEEIELTDYTIRTFSISGEDKTEVRTLKHYHYTAWPDHGVPSSPSSLLNFVRKSSAANPPNAGPMVVHCSAGVGRTGTYIVIDTQLKRMDKHKNIDVYGNVQTIRNQRLWMVQAEEQYIFIHNVLLEAINSGDTEIRLKISLTE